MILGKSEDMTRNPPAKNDKGKGTFCYSTTCTHQHSRGLVGPTAQGKLYNNEEE